jgi:hypothetical protein
MKGKKQKKALGIRRNQYKNISLGIENNSFLQKLYVMRLTFALIASAWLTLFSTGRDFLHFKSRNKKYINSIYKLLF